MKIAFIYDGVYPWITGGIEKRLHELSKKLIERGHEVHWYGIGWWWTDNDHNDMEFDGIHIHGVCKPLNLYTSGKRSIKEAIYFSLMLFPVLMKEKFDIVDCQNFPFFSCFIAKLHSLTGKSTMIVTWHEVWNDYWYEYLGKKGFFGKIIEKMVAHSTGNMVAVSQKTAENLKKIIGGKEIKLIPNGINFKSIQNIKPADEGSDVIFAGRLIKEKNVDVLIKAIGFVKRDIPDIKCLIVGEGPEKDKLKKLTQKLGVKKNIKFMEFFEEYDNLISYMKSSKVFVLPSTREGFGIVVIEANASGLPVVVVDNDMNAACNLINNDKNGFISALSGRRHCR